MTHYTADDVRELARGKNRLDHHDCSLCGVMVGYLIDGEEVYFQSGCGCSWSPPRPSSFADIADWLNMQSSEEVQKRILQGFRP